MNAPQSNPTQGEIFISRHFQAPRELVWEAWTNRDHLTRWHAPEGCEIHFAKFDFRVGGGFHSRIRNPSFGDCWCLGTYLEIVPHERLVYTMAIADAQGNLVLPILAGHDPEWPAETTVTITLTSNVDNTTRLTLHQNVKESLARRTGAYPSWLSMLDRLAEDLVSHPHA
ncbi:SRPBCC family protein [Prosthecobacter dejongeii]|uniref:Uncharacterized protein YndB with AHSA1/START domain n=1 Tax=Prosthecobacter dejongeii TaxID=48465 RepID=A0A7W7YLB7_9BACT|nr:SRPBCC domain-containing protein [Prosthecobacter dejongeii]MBB5038159.1 uncharacterized protein YndB with AHSA1/START domain [Prosthecobacter dejongeii]